MTEQSTTGKEIDPRGVDHPAHYNKHPSGVECIEIIRHHSFNVGTAIKYLWREGEKATDFPTQDLEKAIWYLQDELAMRQKSEAQSPDEPPF